MKSLWTFALLLGVTPSAGLQAMTIDEIIHTANTATYYAGDDGRSHTRMVIVDKNKQKQLRQFTILRKDQVEEGDQDYLVVFNRPADVRGTVLLVHKFIEGEDERWLYLPAMDLEKRISPGDKRTSFVGSDFSYEDISGRNPNADHHSLEEETDQFYITRSTPKEPGSVEFAYYKMQIHKDSFLPLRISYFDEKDNLFREIQSIEDKVIDGIPTILKLKVSDYRTKGYTLMEFRQPKYNLGIPDSVFTSRSLRTPPKKWLRNR